MSLGEKAGQKAKERRRALGYSQEHVAHLAGLSWAAVQRLEAGKIADPHFSTLSGIASALGMTVAELAAEEPVPLGDGPQESGQPEGRHIPVEIHGGVGVSDSVKPLIFGHLDELRQFVRQEYGVDEEFERLISEMEDRAEVLAP
jgi:transcriptional regulator with XRE-family HTH domain